jgi:hypothetical protein
MTAKNKQLLTSESRGDSNRCTPCRKKPDQHAIRFSRSVHVWVKTIHISRVSHIATFHTVINRFEQIHCPREQALLTQSTTPGWLIRESVPNFSPTTANEAMEKSQASVDNRLLGLLGLYQRHAIGTFNTCSRGPTHRSLIDTSRSYSLRGADLLRTTFRPSQPAVSTFHLRAPPGLRLIIQQLSTDLKRDQALNLTSESLHSTSTVTYHLSIAWANDIPPRDRFDKVNS